MDKNARERMPGILALLMGMIGMTATTVICYLTYSDISPREVATRAALAWGVMLGVGYVVGLIATRFMPEPTSARAKAAVEEKKAEAAVPPNEGAKSSALGEGGLNEMDALNLLLNEPHPEMGGKPPGAGAASAAASAPPG